VDKAVLEFLVEFHGKRDYFECHEILEERWKEAPKAERELYFVALIQIAVGYYHWRRENFTGAWSMFHKIVEKLFSDDVYETLTDIGFDVELLQRYVFRHMYEIEHKFPYKSQYLPLKKELLDTCIQACAARGLDFYTDSPMEDTYLINKHLLRKR